ncbi:MAG: TorF family putative porin [Pseudomonadota bacterium]|nr:TorF family putative porin [Pseudomonadota bacterium]
MIFKKIQKTIRKTIFAIFLAIATMGATYASSLDWNVGVTSQYLWRGMSQGPGAAVSGGLDYTADNGFSVGTWVSNVDFGDDTSYELDGYFGYSFGPVSVGYIYYAYPDGDDLDFSEISISGEIGPVTLGVAVLADADWEADLGDDPYFFLDTGFTLREGLDLGIHIGHYDYEAGDAETDYGLSFSIGDFSFGIMDSSRDGSDAKFVISYGFSGSL